jgi:hypothetical protein
MDTKTTTITTTTTTTTTTTITTTVAKKGQKRSHEEDDESVYEEEDEIDIALMKSEKEEKKVPSTSSVLLLSRLKDCRADDIVPDVDAKHPIVVAFRELIEGGNSERVLNFIYSHPRTLRLRLVERAMHSIHEMLWNEYIQTNLFGVGLDHAKPFDGLHLTPEVFNAVNDGQFVDEESDSDSDSDSKSGGDSKALPEDGDEDEAETETEDDDEAAQDSPRPMDTQSDDDDGEGEQTDKDEGDDTLDFSSCDSDSDDELLLAKQARQARRLRDQDIYAALAEQLKEEDTDDKADDIPRPNRLSNFNAPLLSDSAHHSNLRIMNRVVLPWCRRVATKGGPKSALLAILDLLNDIKEQYCEGFTSPQQVKVAQDQAVRATAYGEDPVKSEQMRTFYVDWVGHEEEDAKQMHETCHQALKRLFDLVKGYRKASADSERKDELRLEIGQLCDQALKPVDTLLCILREAIRFETQARKLPLEIKLLEIESKLLADSEQDILPVKYEAYAPFLGSTRTGILRRLNPVRFPDRTSATAYLNSIGIGVDAIQHPEGLRSKSLAFVLALGHANLEQAYHQDPTIVSAFHYADYGCVLTLLRKRREWMASLATVKTLRMNERTLKSMCDSYNSGNQHSGLVPLESKVLLARGCEQRFASVVASLSDVANFTRLLFESIERNKHAARCCEEVKGWTEILLNPLATVLDEKSRASLKDYIAASEVTKRQVAAEKREKTEGNEKETSDYDSDPDEYTLVRSRTARDIVSKFPKSFELAERPDDEADFGVAIQSQDIVLNSEERDARALKRRRTREALAATLDQETDSDEDVPARATDKDGDVAMGS